MYLCLLACLEYLDLLFCCLLPVCMLALCLLLPLRCRRRRPCTEAPEAQRKLRLPQHWVPLPEQLQPNDNPAICPNKTACPQRIL